MPAALSAIVRMSPDLPCHAASDLAGVRVAPVGVVAAPGLTALMAGAVAFRLKVHDAAGFVFGDTTLMVLALLTAGLHAVTA